MANQPSQKSHPRRVSAERDRGQRKGSKAHAAAIQDAAAASNTLKTVNVAARLTEEQAEKLALIGQLQPELKGHSAAVARAIDIAFVATTDDDTLVAGPDAGEAEEGPVTNVDPSVAKLILDALAERTRAYNELAKQVRAVGRQNNILVKLAHQGVTYGRDTVVPEYAVRSFDVHVQRTLDQLVTLAVQDAYSEQVVRQCLQSS